MATVENGLYDRPGFWREPITPDFFFGPDQYAVTKSIRLDQIFHERDLVETDCQKKTGEVRQGAFAQMTATIKIAAPWVITIGQMGLVVRLPTREAAGD